MTVIVAVLLSGLSTALKPIHDSNEAIYNKRQILAAVPLGEGKDPATMPDADIESEIINMYNISYFGKLWFSHSKPTNQLEFMFDTGSSWLWAGTYE